DLRWNFAHRCGVPRTWRNEPGLEGADRRGVHLLRRISAAAPGDWGRVTDVAAGHPVSGGRGAGPDPVVEDASVAGIVLDSAGWNRDPGAGWNDLRALAIECRVGIGNATGSGIHHERSDAHHDVDGCAEGGVEVRLEGARPRCGKAAART